MSKKYLNSVSTLITGAQKKQAVPYFKATYKELTNVSQTPTISGAQSPSETLLVHQILTLTLGWEGSVPLAFMLLTSLLKADISPSFCIFLGPVIAVNASSSCSAIKGVAILFSCSTFKPLSPASTCSTDNATPECATLKKKIINQKARNLVQHMLQVTTTKSIPSLAFIEKLLNVPLRPF